MKIRRIQTCCMAFSNSTLSGFVSGSGDLLTSSSRVFNASTLPCFTERRGSGEFDASRAALTVKRYDLFDKNLVLRRGYLSARLLYGLVDEHLVQDIRTLQVLLAISQEREFCIGNVLDVLNSKTM